MTVAPADQRMIAAVLDREGGFSNRTSDKGGPTNYGITQATLSAWLGHVASVADVQALSRDTATAIYAANYLAAPGIVYIADAGLRELVFDAAIQHSPVRAVQWLQAIVGVVQDGNIGYISAGKVNAGNTASIYRRYLAKRICYYGEIITADAKRGTTPSVCQALNAAGWMNRMAPFVEAAP
jgi:lysozyme family protein